MTCVHYSYRCYAEQIRTSGRKQNLMIRNMMRKDVWRRITMSAALFALLSNNFNSFAQSTDGIGSSNDYNTATPIKHLIVLVGENRTFDHLFATYVPPRGETVSNLLSKGIVDADGRPGRNFKIAQQFQAVAPFDNKYFINLTSDQKTPYEILPEPTLNDAPTTPFLPVGTPDALLALVEPSLEAEDLNLLTTGTATEFSQTTVQD